MVDLSEHVEDFQVPVCPLCDCSVESHDEAVLAEAHGAKFIAHASCVDASKGEG